MKKTSKILALLMVLSLLMSLGAFASGEPSGGGSDETVMSMNGSPEPGVTAYVITADGMEENDAPGVEVEGEITAEYADVFMTIDDFTTTGFQVTDGGEYTIRNSVIVKTVGGPVDANAAGGCIAKVNNGLLTIRDSVLLNSGKGGRNGNYTVDCERTGTMVVINSDIMQVGTMGDDEGYTDDIADPPSNLGLLISGYARANMSVGTSKTYYYGSNVITEGWAAMSTDSAQSGFTFYSYDSVGRALFGGYGTYADTSCVDWFYASQLQSAEVGAIISNNGEIHMRNGDAADADVLAYLPDDYEVTENYGDGRSSVLAGRNDFQLHSPDMGGGGARGDFVAVLDLEDTDIATLAELDADALLIDWSVDYGPAVAEYIDLVKGANILVKSTGADIDLKNVTAESSSGVLLLTALNSDSMSRYALAADDMSGKYVDLTITDSDIAGDVLHYDYQRNTAVVLDNATWSGAYVTIDKAGWDAMWSDAAKADDYCYWILDTDKYFDGEGTISLMSVLAGSTWNVTGESNIDELSVDAGGVVNGIVTVDGVAVDTSKGGHWAGDIVVTPAGASAEPASAEAAAPAAAGASQPATEAEYDAYEEYLRQFMTSYAGDGGDGTFDEGARAMALGELDSVGFGADVNAFPFEMYVNAFGAMDYATFAAGGASAAPAAAGSVVPGTYGSLVIHDDMTFTMNKTGQNMEGEDFVLTVTGTVTPDGEFTITGLFDGDINLIEVATEDQIAADLASVYAAYQG